MNLPNDPIMLLSAVNMKLRDYYESFDDLCDDMNVDAEDLLDKLSSIGYEYDEDENQFV